MRYFCDVKMPTEMINVEKFLKNDIKQTLFKAGLRLSTRFPRGYSADWRSAPVNRMTDIWKNVIESKWILAPIPMWGVGFPTPASHSLDTSWVSYHSPQCWHYAETHQAGKVKAPVLWDCLPPWPADAQVTPVLRTHATEQTFLHLPPSQGSRSLLEHSIELRSILLTGEWLGNSKTEETPWQGMEEGVEQPGSLGVWLSQLFHAH